MNGCFCNPMIVISAVMMPIKALDSAGDHQRPELNHWYESLRSGKGPCFDATAQYAIYCALRADFSRSRSDLFFARGLDTIFQPRA